jgi:hypothetical protein
VRLVDKLAQQLVRVIREIRKYREIRIGRLRCHRTIFFRNF